MRYAVVLIGALCTLYAIGSPRASAQINSDAPAEDPKAPGIGPAQATRYRVGATIKGRNGSVQNIRVMVALPWECAEQQVHVVEEDFSPQVQIDQRTLKGGEARQLLIYVPQLGPREEAHALITFEVITHTLIAPKETATLRVPSKPAPSIKQYLGPSPYIDVGHRAIRKAIKEALEKAMSPPSDDEKADESTDKLSADEDPAADDFGAKESDESNVIVVELAREAPATSESIGASDGEPSVATAADPDAFTDWQRIEAFYDYVMDKVVYEEGKDKSSVQALSQGRGDCQAIGALFVAMCRTEKIPARLVWVHDHQYAEFYLEDEEGAGRWYPVETAGQRDFGGMPTARVILQKGDNFRVPERPRDRLRYASDFALFLSAPSAKPSITYIRERM